MSKNSKPRGHNQPALFAIKFIVLFAVFYGGYLGLIGLTAPGNHYSPFLAHYLNAVHWLRWLLLHATMLALKTLGYHVVVNEYDLLVAGHNHIILNYDCLGVGVMCFFAAFVIAFPKHIRPKLTFLFSGLLIIQLLNVVRLAWLALFWSKRHPYFADQHTIFNTTIYIIIAVALYFWVRGKHSPKRHAAN